MILLTQVEITKAIGAGSKPDTKTSIIAVDAWSVVTVEKYTYNGGSEGSLIHLTDGLAPLIVEEDMTEVVHMVEAAIIKDNVDSQGYQR